MSPASAGPGAHETESRMLSTPRQLRVSVNRKVLNPQTPGDPNIRDFEILLAFWFYKKGCQEKKLLRELEAAKSFGIQPLPLCTCLEAYSAYVGEMFKCRGHRFHNPPFPLIR